MACSPRTLTLLGATVLFCCGLTDATAQARRKKLIATGWDSPTPQQLRRDLATMERRPFDGVVLTITAKGQDKGLGPYPFAKAFESRRWQDAWFAASIADLKAVRVAHPRRLTDNFLMLNANPGNVDWFDDAGWRNIVDHWRIAALIARQGGLKGILFDAEPYTTPFAQFAYAAQPQNGKHSFNEYYAKARQRGREVMRAIIAQYPNVTLFTYFMNSYTLLAAGADDPRPVLARHQFGLYPAFINGWLDVVPPTVTLVDGNEYAYRYNSDLEFYEASVQIRNAAQDLVAPENRAKYRAQVQVSSGIYLDAYCNPKESPWYIDGKGGPRVRRLRANVQTALRAADEYVWIYGEKGRWWPPRVPGENGQYIPWPEALPGCDAALALVRNPREDTRARLATLRQSGKLRDLARGGEFTPAAATPASANGLPAEWYTWQVDDTRGKFTWDRKWGATAPGSLRAADVEEGCFLQFYSVKPGESYAVVARTRFQGKAEPWLRVRWKNADRKWTEVQHDLLVHAAPSSPGSSTRDWREMFGAVVVPDDARELHLLLGVTGQTSPDDIVWFDDVHVYAVQ